MAEKKNYWTQIIGAMNGFLSFGGLSPFKDVTSSFNVTGIDGRHFITMDEDGAREGWTTINAPGSIQCNAGEDLTKGQNGIFLNSENGDIIIRARDGKIRLQGTDIEINATGNKTEDGEKTEGIVWIDANETIKLDAKNITVDGKVATKILSTGVLTLDGKLGMQILSPIIHGATCATNPAKKPGKIR
tara:strand:- start:239 stop:802 length:564 start_codon:yes stop_codon:yes gene_type:complete